MLFYFVGILAIAVITSILFIRVKAKPLLTTGDDQNKPSPHFFPVLGQFSRVRFEHYLSVFRCYSCHFETDEEIKYCPECAKHGKKSIMKVVLKKLSN
jgi:hypothetical protein